MKKSTIYKNQIMKRSLNIFCLTLSMLFFDKESEAQWVSKANNNIKRAAAFAFTIDSIAYIGLGFGASNNLLNDFWAYDPIKNTWTKKANYPAGAVQAAVGFSIGNKGYVGTGANSSATLKSFYEYDPASNTWKRLKDFGGQARFYAAGFNIGNKGYIGTGFESYTNQILLKDFWEFDPGLDTWTQKLDFPGVARAMGVGFAIDNKGYLGTGETKTNWLKDFWQYDQVSGQWDRKADVGNDVYRSGAVGLSNGIKGYIGTGQYHDQVYINDFFEYDPNLDTWTKKDDFTGTPRRNAVGFSIGQKCYIGSGMDSLDTYFSISCGKDFYEFDPKVMGVSENNNQKLLLSVFPNPNTGYLTIQARIPENSVVGIIIYDVLGANMLDISETCNFAVYSKEIDLSALKKGIYFLNFNLENASSIQRLIVIN